MQLNKYFSCVIFIGFRYFFNSYLKMWLIRFCKILYTYSSDFMNTNDVTLKCSQCYTSIRKLWTGWYVYNDWRSYHHLLKPEKTILFVLPKPFWTTPIWNKWKTKSIFQVNSWEDENSAYMVWLNLKSYWHSATNHRYGWDIWDHITGNTDAPWVDRN